VIDGVAAAARAGRARSTETTERRRIERRRFFIRYFFGISLPNLARNVKIVQIRASQIYNNPT
jgi:hypothetical protein